MNPTRTTLAAAILLAAGSGAGLAQNVTTGPAIATQSLLDTGKTIVDQPIAYPSGTPNITAAIITIAPGKETGWHVHPVPLFVHILEGEVTVDYGKKGTHSYKPGDSFLEAMNWPHNGMNKTDKPVRILTVYAGAKGVTNSQPVDKPN